MLAGYLPDCGRTMSAPYPRRGAQAAREVDGDGSTSFDGSRNSLVRTACVGEVILLSLDPVFETFRFPSRSRDLGLHLF